MKLGDRMSRVPQLPQKLYLSKLRRDFVGAESIGPQAGD